MKWAGLTAPEEARSACERRLWLMDAPSEVLESSLYAMVIALRAQASASSHRLSAFAGAPWPELAASPFNLRAVALGVRAGASCVAHDLRRLLPLDDVSLSIADPNHGVWDCGVLMTGKYQSFQHDDPLLSRNPNHMARWTGHEMLHRAGGFWWSPGVDRWSLYLASRLNELVPVAHWYWTDSMLRESGDGFDREREGADRVVSLSSLSWLRWGEEELRSRVRASVPLLRSAARHVDEELADIAAEMDSGRVVARRRALRDGVLLDASSDAVAYVVGHVDRLRSRNVGSVLSMLPEVERWMERDVRAYYDRTEALFDALIFGEIAINDEQVDSLGRERQRWDVLLRAAHHPATNGRHLRRLLRDVVDREVWSREELYELAKQSLGEVSADFAFCDGRGLGAGELFQLKEGLSSIAPAFVGVVEERALLEPLLTAFVQSAAFYDRRSLADRLDGFLESYSSLTPALIELWRFERALAEAPPADPLAEHLAVDVDEEAVQHSWWLTPSSSFRLHRCRVDILPWYDACLAGAEGSGDEPPLLEASYSILIGRKADEIQVLPAPRGVVSFIEESAERPTRVRSALAHLAGGELAIDALNNEWPETAEDWLVDLLVAGVLVARPDL